MSLIRLEDISIEFGDNPLLKEANIAIEPNERICLVGRNGAGKTTLLNIISGDLEADQGFVHRQKHLRVSQLQQTLPEAIETKVIDVIKEGLKGQLSLIEEYERVASQTPPDDKQMQRMQDLQAEIDAGGGWQIEKQAETIISQLDLPAEKTLAQLSGGWRRRVALGKALVS